jgi:hypothetical protein
LAADLVLGISSKFKNIIPDLEKHYDLKYRGTEEILFQYFPVSKGIAEEPNCANSKYLRKKWVKVKDLPWIHPCGYDRG